jgi:hypothetical protein
MSLLAEFLEQDQAAAELKVCQRTLDRWRRLGDGPPITKIGRRVLYRRSSLQAWLHGLEHHGHGDNSTSEESNVRKHRRSSREYSRGNGSRAQAI